MYAKYELFLEYKQALDTFVVFLLSQDQIFLRFSLGPNEKEFVHDVSDIQFINGTDVFQIQSRIYITSQNSQSKTVSVYRPYRYNLRIKKTYEF